ncbi:MAG TPA: hypothetical protein VNE39_20515 [Planctomycetota bacterium]|nr:hypothetical protein [Planctomycetota bacterium]
MRQSGMARVAWLLALWLPVAAAPRAARGEPKARVLETEAWVLDKTTVVVRGAFEVTGEPHLWYGFYAQVRVNADKAGKVTRVEFACSHPFVLRRSRDACPIQGLEMQLKLRHLQPKPGVKLCRAANSKYEPYDVLLLGDRQTYLWTADRGFFFQSIDGPQKALELFQLAHGGAVVIKTRQQFDAIVNVLRPLAKKEEPPPKKKEEPPPSKVTVPVVGTVPGPLPCEGFRLLAQPPSFGVSVTEEPGVGYRINVLLIEFNRYTRSLGDIRHHDVVVTTDGRIGDRATLCVKGPEAEYSRPPFWVQPGPTSAGHYAELLKPVLKPDGSEAIPRMAVVTARPATFPSAEGDPDDERFFTPPDQWPDEAKR